MHRNKMCFLFNKTLKNLVSSYSWFPLRKRIKFIDGKLLFPIMFPHYQTFSPPCPSPPNCVVLFLRRSKACN